MIYNAFLSVQDSDTGLPPTIRIEAQGREDARQKLAERFLLAGHKVELSATSEEVSVFCGDYEAVYYGFDE